MSIGVKRVFRALGLTRHNLFRLLPRVHVDAGDISTPHRRPRQYIAAIGRTGHTSVDDSALVSRLLAAYRRSFDASYYGRGIWGELFHDRQRPLHETLMAGSQEDAARILRDPAHNDLLYGFDNIFASNTAKILADPNGPQQMAVACKMHLVSLGEALGLERVENPESYGVNPLAVNDPDTDDLLDRVESVLDAELRFPNPFPDEFGLGTSRGVASDRAFHALYQAYRIRALLSQDGEGAVVEIGGGTGRTAFFARLLGVRDYTIVDLPITAIVQGYFLGRALGNDAVSLDGEAPLPGAIRLMSPSSFHGSSESFALAANFDSMPEMPLSVQVEYARTIKRRARLFLSINHEAGDHVVREAMATGPISRFPYWMRPGYIEEVFRC